MPHIVSIEAVVTPPAVYPVPLIAVGVVLPWEPEKVVGHPDTSVGLQFAARAEHGAARMNRSASRFSFSIATRLPA